MSQHWKAAKTVTRRQWRIAAAVLLAGLVTAGSAQALRVDRAPAPEGSWSLGSADVYVEIRDLGGKAQSVSIPLTEKEVRWLDAASLRFEWWSPEEKRFKRIDGFRYDAGKGAMQGTVSKEGRYGVFGFSRWSHVSGLQERLCVPGELVTDALIDRLCLVILCPAFDEAAWSQAWRDGTGEFVPPGEVGEHFENLCDRCTEHPTGVAMPDECAGGALPPPDGVDPPELEQLPNGIDNGGRAVSIAVRPGNDDAMIVAAETGGLFASDDGGDTWRHTSADTTFDFSDLQYLPGAPNVVAASAHRDTRVASGGGVWRSADGGATWTQRTLTPPVASCAQNLGAYALELDADGVRLWAGTTCGLAYSDDAALTWRFLAAAPGYNHDKVYAVATSAGGNLKILTDAGVKVTTNGGASWTVSTTGLPVSIGLIGKGVHNQIAVSPRDAPDVYWSFAYWKWDTAASDWQGRWGLYLSTNNGSSWSAVLDQPGLNRAPFVRLAEPLSGGANRYDLYSSDGGCTFQRSTVTHGTTPTFSAWTAMIVDHCDPADVAFANDRATPLLLASDGGLHKTADGGLTWRFTGGGSGGYNALQITEVIGQQHSLGGVADLYFATQDNDIWASSNLGRTWTGRLCCEGFFLNVPRQPLPPAETRVTGVACAGCVNIITEPLLANEAGFPNPPNNDGNPKLLQPGAYIQNTRLPGVNANLFNLTIDTGGVWTPRYGFPEPVRALSQIAGPAATPVVFTAAKMPGTTPTGDEMVQIKRITDVLGSGTPVVSQVAGFGSLGTFPTMFAWYKPFGVDPADPNFFLVPDIIGETVRKSVDGGAHWTADAALTGLVTAAGAFRFRWGEFVQVSSFGFDPDCPGNILVGSTQAGIFRSVDGGGSWERVNGTQRIPRVSSFYFSGDGTTVVSSYGRGLWLLRSACASGGPFHIGGFQILEDPALYLRGVIVPLRSIDDPAACPQCAFLLAQGGEVLEYVLTPEGEVSQIVLSGGRLAAYSSQGKEIAVPVAWRTGGTQRKLPPDGRLTALLAAGNRVQGMSLEDRKLKGLVVSGREAGPADLPVARPLAPYIAVDLPSIHGAGLRRLKGIDVIGYGFDSRYPITLTLDGVLVNVKPVFDDKGVFRLRVPPTVAVGGHTFRVEQKNNLGTFRDAYSFNVTVEDSPRE